MKYSVSFELSRIDTQNRVPRWSISDMMRETDMKREGDPSLVASPHLRPPTQLPLRLVAAPGVKQQEMVDLVWLMTRVAMGEKKKTK